MDSRNFSPTIWASSFCGWAPILEDNLLSVGYLPLSPAFETIRLHINLPNGSLRVIRKFGRLRKSVDMFIRNANYYYMISVGFVKNTHVHGYELINR